MATQTPDKVKKISQREKGALSFWGPQAAVYFGASQSFIYLFILTKLGLEVFISCLTHPDLFLS